MNTEPIVVKKQKKEKFHAVADEEGEDDNSTYAKFKTQHEMEISEAYKTGPSYFSLDEIDEILPFGSIV